MDTRIFGVFFKKETATRSGAIKMIPRRDKGVIPSYISPRITCRNGCDYPSFYDYFYCEPTQELVNLIEQHMMRIDNDAIYFEMIFFKDSIALYAKYNQIIGSRLIATISHDSMPDFLKES